MPFSINPCCYNVIYLIFHTGLEAWSLGKLKDFGMLISASGRSSIQNYECGITYIPKFIFGMF